MTIYALNGERFNINQFHLIGDTQYPAGWFLDASNRAAMGVVEVIDTPPPTIDPATQRYVELPMADTGGGLARQWAVEALDAGAIAEKRAESEAAAAEALANNLQNLWVAANAYTENYISGVAIGLLTIGVIQGKSKAIAVTAWSSSVWDEYYRRKATVTAVAPASLDFSSFGPMPHTVPELRAELGM